MKSKVFEIGSEYDWKSNDEFYTDKNDFFETLQKRNIKFLRSGRDAIRYVARVCKTKCTTVLMPALMCECVPQQFVEEGYQVIYYRVKPDFTADIQDIEEKICSNAIFFYMNYFGIPFLKEEQEKRIRSLQEKIVFVEDITHDFLKRRNEKFKNEYTVCSIRKWFAVPDGGMVIAKNTLEAICVEKNDAFANLREEAMKKKNIYLETGEAEKKSIFRELLSEANHLIDNINQVASMQEKSMDILAQLDLKRIYELRVDNVNELAKEIASISGVRSLVDEPSYSTLYYPIYVENGQAELQRRMAENGVYLPVIWPVPKDATGVCQVADNVANSMLAIPCDHRYGVEEMKKVIQILSKCVK